MPKKQLTDLPDALLGKIVSNLPRTSRAQVSIVNKTMRQITQQANRTSPAKSPAVPANPWQVGDAKLYHMKLPSYPYVEFGVWDAEHPDLAMYEALDPKTQKSLFTVVPTVNVNYMIYTIIVKNRDFYKNAHWVKLVLQEAFAHNPENPLYTQEIYNNIMESPVSPSLEVSIQLRQRKA